MRSAGEKDFRGEGIVIGDDSLHGGRIAGGIHDGIGDFFVRLYAFDLRRDVPVMVVNRSKALFLILLPRQNRCAGGFFQGDHRGLGIHNTHFPEGKACPAAVLRPVLQGVFSEGAGIHLAGAGDDSILQRNPVLPEQTAIEHCRRAGIGKGFTILLNQFRLPLKLKAQGKLVDSEQDQETARNHQHRNQKNTENNSHERAASSGLFRGIGLYGRTSFQCLRLPLSWVFFLKWKVGVQLFIHDFHFLHELT